jgi:hypothetical protein
MRPSTFFFALAFSALAAAPVTYAQSTFTANPFIASTAPFTPDAKVEFDTETGIVDGLPYRFFYSDGKGLFAGSPGNELNGRDKDGSNWSVRCTKDAMSDERTCLVLRQDLFVSVSNRQKPMLGIGHNHFPGSTIALRIDGQPAVTEPVRPAGLFPAKVGERLIAQLGQAKSISTRYIAWPQRNLVDATWEPHGFQSAYRYASWAVQQGK